MKFLNIMNAHNIIEAPKISSSVNTFELWADFRVPSGNIFNHIRGDCRPQIFLNRYEWPMGRGCNNDDSSSVIDLVSLCCKGDNI